jgi:hypothetical protein
MLPLLLVPVVFSVELTCGGESESMQIGGIYPRLAVTNGGNSECGIGAVVPWAGRLWFITYPASGPRGSDDKLYSLDQNLQRTVWPESVGGTHANRMIHRESNQLIIGPYFIDAKGKVRVVSPKVMPGRLTATTRHLRDPANKVYFVTMEEGLYELDVHTLAVKVLHPDLDAKVARVSFLPGDHGKGGYVGQGRLVVTNNATGGVLTEWTGTGDPGQAESWTTVDRNKYTDVTGPGGIHGAPDKNAPLWAIGWDAKSLLLNVCDGGRWIRFRLPKASFTYDADNGCYTEWPRIREVGGKRIMTMHGMFFDFPTTFSRANTAGIRPIATCLKMVVDFADWNGRLVCALDDASKFGNPLSGRPQSNLWFVSESAFRELGRPAGYGGPWVQDRIKAEEPSDPFWLGGARSFPYRVVHFAQGGNTAVTFTLEIDTKGNGRWSKHAAVTVPAGGYAYQLIPAGVAGEWIRVKADRDAGSATAYFHYGSPGRAAEPEMFASLAPAGVLAKRSEGLLLPTNDPEDLTLAFAASVVDSRVTETGYYVIGGDLKLRRLDQPEAERALRREAETKQGFQVDEASVIITDKTTRYRLPKGPETLTKASASGWRRVVREVVTERSLMNVGGTIYELPRSGSGGMAKIRPVTTHNRHIFDFTSWRGLLVLSGNLIDANLDKHYVRSEDGKVGLWLGNVDDLWKLGPPRGEGGPWFKTPVKAGEPSDRYLMTGYDRKLVRLSQEGQSDVRMTIEVDVTGENIWHSYQTISVPAGRTVEHAFPLGFSAHWVRMKANHDCRATAWFVYTAE